MGDRLVKWVGKEARQIDKRLKQQKGKIRDVMNRRYAILETCYVKKIKVEKSRYSQTCIKRTSLQVSGGRGELSPGDVR